MYIKTQYQLLVIFRTNYYVEVKAISKLICKHQTCFYQRRTTLAGLDQMLMYQSLDESPAEKLRLDTGIFTECLSSDSRHQFQEDLVSVRR